MAISSYGAVSTRQTLDIEFEISKLHKGVVTAAVQPDDDPELHGKTVLFPGHATSEFCGFPLCEAAVKSTGGKGYASMYGWTQMVKCDNDGLTEATRWEMDPIPITNDLNTPFVWFGPEPKLFDAPFRLNVRQVDWICHSFLTVLDDNLMTRKVRPILGFEWGFWMVDGKVKIKRLRQISLDAWDDKLELLRSTYKGWTFYDQNVPL